tara:strand:- start:140 stop:376 length:237 start_codon:yes stop_codon:yes gene_type:complete
MTVSTLSDLQKIRQSDVSVGANTYIVPLVNNKLKFIRDELCFVEEVTEENFTIFRSMDGKRYTFSQDDLKNFKLVGRP